MKRPPVDRRWPGRGSQQLVLPQVHPLDDVPAVVEDAANVLGVNGTGEVRVAVVLPFAAGRADPLRDRRVGRGSDAQAPEPPRGRSHTRNSSLMKNLALVTRGSSSASGTAKWTHTPVLADCAFDGRCVFPTFSRNLVVAVFRKIILQFGFSCQNLVRQNVLFVQEQDD